MTKAPLLELTGRQGYGEIGTLMHLATLENNIAIAQKLNLELPYDPAILPLGIYPPKTESKDPSRHLYNSVHS